jgi:hypothetical protein
MTTDTDIKSIDLARVKQLHDRKRELEVELTKIRGEWRDAMIDARNHGVTVSDISREIGVVAPNLFRILRDGK